MRFLLFLAIVFVIYTPETVHANKSVPLKTDPAASYDPVVMPTLTSTSIILDDDGTPPSAPNIGQVKFLKMPKLNSIEEQVDRLVQGISLDVQPEYDHFGYEIRRYMSRVGDPEIYEDGQFLIDQIKNVRKANVIAEYWGKHIEKEIADIEEKMKNQKGISRATKTAFRQNKIKARSFMVALKAWIKSNEEFLMVLYDNPRSYSLDYPDLNVSNARIRTDIYNKLLIKRTRLEGIKKYMGFAMMAY